MVFICFASTAARAHIALLLRRHHHTKASPQPVTWEKPGSGWLKLNFDGASKNTSRSASIGCVYRDHEGEFVYGYAEQIGKATSSVAELAAAKRGIELALSNGWMKIWIEGDAKVVVDVLTKGILKFKAEEDQKLAREITELVPHFNDFNASHVYRQGNRVAHKLAKLGYKKCKPQIWRDLPPNEILNILRQDAEGKSIIFKK